MKIIRTIAWLFLISFILPLQAQAETFPSLSESDCIREITNHTVTGKIKKIFTDERMVSLTTDAGHTILLDMGYGDEPDKYTPFLNKTVRIYYTFDREPSDKEEEGYCSRSNRIDGIITADPNYTDDCIYKIISDHNVTGKVEKISADTSNPSLTVVTDAGETISLDTPRGYAEAEADEYAAFLGEAVKIHYDLVQYPFTEMGGYCPRINRFKSMVAATATSDEQSNITVYKITHHSVTGKVEKISTFGFNPDPSITVVTDAGETFSFGMDSQNERDKYAPFLGKPVKIQYYIQQRDFYGEMVGPKFYRITSMTTTDASDVQSYNDDTDDCTYGVISRHILTGKAETISHNDNMFFLDVVTDEGEDRRFHIGYMERHKYAPFLGKTVKIQYDFMQYSYNEHDGYCPQDDAIRAIATVSNDCVYGIISSHDIGGVVGKISTDEDKKATSVAVDTGSDGTYSFDIPYDERDKYTPFLGKEVDVQYDLVQHTFDEVKGICPQTNTIRSMILR